MPAFSLEGSFAALEALTNYRAGMDLILRLYTDGPDNPGPGDSAGDYTEASFVGYAPIRCDGSLWEFADEVPARADFPMQEFNCKGDGKPQPIRGYYLTQSGTGRFVHGVSFDETFSVGRAGEGVRVTPSLVARGFNPE